jgi:hypothetical protein
MDGITSDCSSEAVKAALGRLDTARRACSSDHSEAAALEYKRARAAYANALRADGQAAPDEDPLGTGTE